MSDDIDRAELRRLSEEASAGPWGVLGQYVFADEGRDGIAQFSIEPDSAFIAAARVAVPALLDALEHAEAAEEQLLLRNRNLLEAHQKAEARIQAVRDLHVEAPGFYTDDGSACGECIVPWPCATIRALDGDA